MALAPTRAALYDLILLMLGKSEDGVISDEQGRVSAAICRMLELPETEAMRKDVSAVLARMEKENIVRRQVNGTRTSRVELLTTLSPERIEELEASAAQNHAALGTEPAAKNRKRVVKTPDKKRDAARPARKPHVTTTPDGPDDRQRKLHDIRRELEAQIAQIDAAIAELTRSGEQADSIIAKYKPQRP